MVDLPVLSVYALTTVVVVAGGSLRPEGSGIRVNGQELNSLCKEITCKRNRELALQANGGVQPHEGGIRRVSSRKAYQASSG